MAGKPFRRKGSSRWCVVVELPRDPVTGERRQQWIYGATRKEVQEEQTKLLREIDTGTSLDPTKITVGEYLGHWLEVVARPKSVLTYEKHEGTIRNHLIPAFGGLPLKKLSSLHVARLYADLKAKGYAPNTIRGIHGCLFAALEKARKWRMLSENPADLDEDTPPADKTPAYIWDAETLARFLEHIRGRRFEPHYHVALNTGLRMGEILGLHWADLDWDRAMLTVARQQIRSVQLGRMETTTKGKRARAVTLAPETIAVLRAHRDGQRFAKQAAGEAWQEGDRVFPNTTGGGLSERTIKADWLRSIRRWGLPEMHFHGLRHLHATYLLVAGVHPKVVSERLGHSDTATTMNVYSHVTPGLQGEAAAIFEAVLKAKLGAARSERAGEDTGADGERAR